MVTQARRMVTELDETDTETIDSDTSSDENEEARAKMK